MQWYNWETNVEESYDASAYEGLYTVTEETKGCTGLGRVFKNANGKWLYAFSYDNWEQATDNSNSAQWCIGDDLGYSPDSGAFIYGDTVSKGTLPNSNFSWNSMMYTVKACTITTQVTALATEAIPMILKGSKGTGYDEGSGTLIDETSSIDYTKFDFEPQKYWCYAGYNDRLIGNAITSKVPASLYVPFTENKTTAETGQTITFSSDVQMATIDGVKCASFDYGVDYVDISPVDFLTTGKKGFAITTLINNPYDDSSRVCVLFSAYTSTTPTSFSGLQIVLERNNQFRINGGNPKNSYNGFNPYVDTYYFERKKWVHFTYVYFGGYERVYIDGKEIWDNKCERDFLPSETSYLTIGHDVQHDGSSGWDGYISQFKYYSYPISEGQIKEEYNRCKRLIIDETTMGTGIAEDYTGPIYAFCNNEGTIVFYMGGTGTERIWTNGGLTIKYNNSTSQWEMLTGTTVLASNSELTWEGWSNPIYSIRM